MSSLFTYVRVRKDDAQFFCDMDPFEKLGVLSSPFGFAIGVFYDTPGEIKIAGLMCGSATPESLTVDWLVTNPAFMRQGIGEELLSRAFLMAAIGGIKEVYASIFPDYLKEELTKDGEKYLRARLFTGEREIGSDMDFLISEIMDSDFMKSSPHTNEGIMPISSMTGAQKREFIKRLAMIENATYTYDPVEMAGIIDDDLSFVVTENESIRGAILVGDYGDSLWPIYHYAANEAVSDDLIKYAVYAAERRYGDRKSLFVSMRQEETISIMERIIKPIPRAKLLVASVRDYYRAVNEA